MSERLYIDYPRNSRDRDRREAAVHSPGRSTAAAWSSGLFR
jgi:hypothetical protein